MESLTLTRIIGRMDRSIDLSINISAITRYRRPTKVRLAHLCDRLLDDMVDTLSLISNTCLLLASIDDDVVLSLVQAHFVQQRQRGLQLIPRVDCNVLGSTDAFKVWYVLVDVLVIELRQYLSFHDLLELAQVEYHPSDRIDLLIRSFVRERGHESTAVGWSIDTHDVQDPSR